MPVKKAILIILAAALAITLIWRFWPSDNAVQKPPKNRIGDPVSISKSKETTDRLQKKLAQIKDRSTVLEQAAKLAAQQSKTSRPYQRGDMKKDIEASVILDKAIAQGHLDQPVSAHLEQQIRAMLVEQKLEAITLMSISCINTFCRATFSLNQPERLGSTVKNFTDKSWPWKERSHLMITQNQKPVSSNEQLDFDHPMDLKIDIYSSNSDEPLPLDRPVSNLFLPDRPTS